MKELEFNGGYRPPNYGQAVAVIFMLTVLLFALLAIRRMWNSAVSEVDTIRGLNSGQLEYGADGKIRQTNRDLDFKERKAEMERQREYQRKLQNTGKAWP